ncbi:MAG TPA: signal peptidase II [Dehalococcoidia bacterium]|nr:signal peptidase II [Dehalococcoidia bacterium]
MRKEDSPLDKWRGVVLGISFLLVVIADQLTKLWVRSYEEGEVIYQLGFFQFTHVQNTGASFGIFKGHSFTLMIVDIVGVILLLAMAFYVYRRLPYLVNLLNIIAFSLILGGTVGNLIDRLRLEHVTDFIDVGFWPVFNVADSAITVGVIVLAFSLIRLAVSERRRST